MDHPQFDDSHGLIGPFRQTTYKLVTGGYVVPHAHVLFTGGDPDGRSWELVVDGRFSTEAVTLDEIKRWAFVLANMGAVCAGYSCHGENSGPLNRFNCRIGKIGSDTMAEMRRSEMKLVPDDDA